MVAEGRTVYTIIMISTDQSPVRSDPAVLGGTLIFRGTRVKAQTLLDYLAAGDSLETFLEHFPTVGRDEAIKFLHLAREEDHP